MSISPRKIVVIGLGTAGTDHVKALEDIPYATVIAGIDTDPSRTLTFRRREVAVYPGAFEAISHKLDPDLVVIATPTHTHAGVCGEVAEYFPKAVILVEKPAADKLEDAQRIVEGVGGKQRVNVAYHMAFSAEVAWGLSQAHARADQLGPPVAIESWYADPYQSDLASAQATLGTSWIDSGINALSVIERFATLIKRTSWCRIEKDSWSGFAGTFVCETQGRQVAAVVLTSWSSIAPTRTTRIKYLSGADLVMDHNAMVAYIVKDGAIADISGSDGVVPRREAHYKALYQSWLVDRVQVFPMDTSLRLHRLLLDGLNEENMHSQNRGSP